MLYESTVSADTLSLLKNLMGINELNDYNLAGGTALALQMGHRLSYDLDFFGRGDMSIEEVTGLIPASYFIQEMHRTKNILVLDVDGIKVDFVLYKYPMIRPLLEEGGIRLFSIEDIAAMKLDAIKGRGRKRDFYDLYFLLNHYGLSELLAFHQEKYQQDTRFLILKSMSYFDDAENDPPVRLTGEEIHWEDVKSTIKKYLQDV